MTSNARIAVLPARDTPSLVHHLVPAPHLLPLHHIAEFGRRLNVRDYGIPNMRALFVRVSQ